MLLANPRRVFGFHACDETVGRAVLNRYDELLISSKDYNWLGDGIYFWENNYERARQYAEEDKVRKGSKIDKPFVIGAIIDLGSCLDLLDQRWLDFISDAYEEFKKSTEENGKLLPTNGRFTANDFDFKKRELDCAVIRYAHRMAKEHGITFDSVRAAFPEDRELYAGAGFRLRTHIQLAIQPHCIQGIFLPKEEVPRFPKR